MYLAGRNQVLAELPLVESFRGLRAAGFDAVELCHEHRGMSVERMSVDFAADIAAMLAETELRASAAGWHCDYTARDERYEDVQQLIPLTPVYGTDVFIIACSGAGGDQDLWPQAVERTRRLCEIAEGNGVRLALEYEPRFLVHDRASLCRLMDAVGSEALCANLDLGHAFLAEDDPLATIRELGSRVVHCHVENMASGAHKHLLPWEGDMDLGAYFQALASAGFDGALALDLYGLDYLGEAPRCVNYLRALLPGRGISD
jgi:sugar phosphate isomerase/epimerase